MDSNRREILERLLKSYPWFTSARRVLSDNAESSLLTAFRGVRTDAFRDVDPDSLTRETDNHIIDRFLQCQTLKIVAEEENATGEEIQTEAVIESDDDIASEALAEIYLSQGMTDKAIETYEKLGLLFPEKSVYFAGRIAQIKQEKI